MAKIKYIVQEGQSIWDVVLLKYGTLEEVGTFLADNTNLTFNTDLTALQEVFINTDVVGEADIKNNYIITNFVTNKPSAFRKSMNGQWIADTQLIVDQQSELHIRGVQRFTTIKKSGGYDHRIVHAQLVALSYEYSKVIGFDCQRLNGTQRPN